VQTPHLYLPVLHGEVEMRRLVSHDHSAEKVDSGRLTSARHLCEIPDARVIAELSAGGV